MRLGGPSVRARLTVWHAGVLTLIVCLFSAGIFVFVKARLDSALDEQIRRDLVTIEKVYREEPWDLPELDHRMGISFFEIVDGGRLAYRTIGWPPTGAYRAGATEDNTMRITVARDETALRRTLGTLAAILAMGIPGAIGLAVVGGYFLAGRLLAPVGAMAATARRIGAESLTERLPVADPRDEFGQLASVFNDTLARLEEAFEQLRRFTADASHELRTPLTAMRSVGEVALQQSTDTAEYREVIGSMLEEVDRLTRLVENLLTLTRGESGRIPVASGVVDLSELAASVSDSLHVLAEEKHQSLEVETASHVRAPGDPAILRQGLVNLLHNAIKYTPDRGAIRVVVKLATSGEALIEVKDTGPGIPAGDRQRIFERFYRVDGGRSREAGGVGLAWRSRAGRSRRTAAASRSRVRRGRERCSGSCCPSLSFRPPAATEDFLTRTSGFGRRARGYTRAQDGVCKVSPQTREVDMTGTAPTAVAGHWKEIAASLFRLGATSYGGPAIMGVMQAELQQKRAWVSKERFLEGLAVANMLPGATATQLGIFLGYARGGWRGGLLGGVCFVLPAFVIILALTMAYAGLSVTPVARGALYGLGPVVLGLYAVAVYRLGRAAATTGPEVAIGVLAAAASIGTSLGIVLILVLAGIAGLLLCQPARPRPFVAILSSTLFVAVLAGAWWLPTSTLVPAVPGGNPDPKNLWDIGIYFLKVGAFTIGGGLAMIAFIQDQVVGQFGWLTPREFIDGLALGQLTPGPVLMIAAYVGYKIAGTPGAAVAASAAFLPSFIIMLGILPVLDRVRKLAWVRAVMKGMAPAVIGVLAVSLFRLAPAALPDLVAVAILAATLLALVIFRIGAFKLMIAGAILGVVRRFLPAIPGFRAVYHLTTWTSA